MANGKTGFIGTIRNRKPLLCPHRGIGYHLVQRFTLKKEPFPDVKVKEQWFGTPLFTANNPRQPISYDEQAASLRETLNELKIYIRKLTHMYRVGGARQLDECGIDDQVGRVYGDNY